MATEPTERRRRGNREVPDIVVRLRARREKYRQKGLIYKTAWITAGIIVVLAGLVMVVLPGPALLVIPIGLAMLALQFAWAENLLERALVRARDAGESASNLSRQQKIAGGVAIALASACAIAAGLFLFVL
ncbi:MAG TPA: PGPGW domain-containing protein [Solirubrobacteraceae bacterium]|nr:PGPGW domain-containing protein [Solirubrobacteraceae bacterium]